MRIPEDFFRAYQIDTFTIHKKYYSKRNSVYWIKAFKEKNIERDITVKYFCDSYYYFKKEASILELLAEKGVAVPRVYYKSKGIIIMEHIKGDLLLDKVLEYEANNQYNHSNQLIEKLTCWFLDFINATKDWKRLPYMKGDVNLRNFILNDKIYGIDFENSKVGSIEEDIGKLLAYTLTYTPEFTDWRVVFSNNLLGSLCKALHLDRDMTISYMNHELSAIIQKRRLIVSPKKLQNCNNVFKA